GYEIALPELMIFHFEFADESRANAERADLSRAAESLRPTWPQRKQDERRASRMPCAAQILMTRQDHDHRRNIRVPYVVFFAAGDEATGTDLGHREFIAEQVRPVAFFRDPKCQQPPCLQRRNGLTF